MGRTRPTRHLTGGPLPHLAWLGLCACGPAAMAADAPAVDAPATTETRKAPAAEVPQRRPFEPVAAGQEARIEAGRVELGSRPGSDGRLPAREADLVAVELGAFSIDRMPYPNDPAKPALTGLNREEAAGRCRAEGKRLCSELEWEHACKGPAAEPTGVTAVEQCEALGEGCSSGFGLVRMGLGVAEWTASDAPGGLGGLKRTAVVRGLVASDATGPARCAARAGAAPDEADEARGFRCCRGDEPAATYPTHEELPLIRPLRLGTQRARTILGQVEGLEDLARELVPFDEDEIDEALRRGDRSRRSIRVWTILPSSFAWSPAPGEELWVISGYSGDRSVMAVVWPMAGDRFIHAGSTVIEEPETSLAVGYNEQYPRQLIWTTCYDCPGEGGILLYDEDSRVRIGYR